MTRADLTEKLLDIKREKGRKYICEQIGGISPILVTGAVLGQMKKRCADARQRNADAADRPADLSVLRADHGQWPRAQGVD
jgi:hypothetical protein